MRREMESMSQESGPQNDSVHARPGPVRSPDPLGRGDRDDHGGEPDDGIPLCLGVEVADLSGERQRGRVSQSSAVAKSVGAAKASGLSNFERARACRSLCRHGR